MQDLRSNEIIREYYTIKSSISKNCTIDNQEITREKQRAVKEIPLEVEGKYSKRLDDVLCKVKEKGLRDYILKKLNMQEIRRTQGHTLYIDRHATEKLIALIDAYAGTNRKVVSNLKTIDYGLGEKAELRGNSVYVSKQYKNIVYQAKIDMCVSDTIGYNIQISELGKLFKVAKSERQKLRKSGSEDAAKYNALITSIKRILDEYEALKVEYEPVRSVVHTDAKIDDYQYYAADFLLNAEKGILADKVGAGKTKSVILIGEYLSKYAKLVVCPKTLKFKWLSEIMEVNPNASVSFSIRDIAPGKYVIIHYQELEEQLEQIMDYKESNGDASIYFICDEAHRLGGVTPYGVPTAKWTQATFAATEGSKFLTLITATPIRDRVITYYNLLALIEHEIAFNYKYFFEKYCANELTIENKYTAKYSGGRNLDELYERTKDKVLRRLKIDGVESLVDREFTPVELDDVSYEVHNKLIEKYRVNHNTNYMVTVYEGYKQSLAKVKMMYTLQLAQDYLESGEQVVIFSYYNDLVNIAYEIINSHGFRCGKIVSKESASNRYETCNKLNEGKLDAVVCTIGVGGEGLDFITPEHMIINDIGWRYTELIQAEGRADRRNRTERVNVQYIYTYELPLEHRIMTVVQRKMENYDKSMGNLDGDSLKNDIIAALNEMV